MPDKSWLDGIAVDVPCPEDWAAMRGDDRARFCARCRLTVYDLSSMTRPEAEELIRGREGRVCARFHRRPDGRVVTKDCVTIAARLRRRMRWVAAMVATLIGASALAAATSGGDADGGSLWDRDPWRSIAQALGFAPPPPPSVTMGIVCPPAPPPAGK